MIRFTFIPANTDVADRRLHEMLRLLREAAKAHDAEEWGNHIEAMANYHRVKASRKNDAQ